MGGVTSQHCHVKPKATEPIDMSGDGLRGSLQGQGHMKQGRLGSTYCAGRGYTATVLVGGSSWYSRVAFSWKPANGRCIVGILQGGADAGKTAWSGMLGQQQLTW